MSDRQSSSHWIGHQTALTLHKQHLRVITPGGPHWGDSALPRSSDHNPSVWSMYPRFIKHLSTHHYIQIPAVRSKRNQIIHIFSDWFQYNNHVFTLVTCGLPSQRASNTELYYCLRRQPEKAVEHNVKLPMIWSKLLPFCRRLIYPSWFLLTQG